MADPPVLSPAEVERYARHLVLREVGGPGQQKLKAARMLIVGAGGLGSPAALYLAAAGVGRIGLVDADRVALSNLQRQILFATSDVGAPKVAAGAAHLAALNPEITVVAHDVRLDAGNADALVSAYDILLDGTDDYASPLTTVATPGDGSLTNLPAAIQERRCEIVNYQGKQGLRHHYSVWLLIENELAQGTILKDENNTEYRVLGTIQRKRIDELLEIECVIDP